MGTSIGFWKNRSLNQLLIAKSTDLHACGTISAHRSWTPGSYNALHMSQREFVVPRATLEADNLNPMKDFAQLFNYTLPRAVRTQNSCSPIRGLINKVVWALAKDRTARAAADWFTDARNPYSLARSESALLVHTSSINAAKAKDVSTEGGY